jgi:hypothetical protein
MRLSRERSCFFNFICDEENSFARTFQQLCPADAFLYLTQPSLPLIIKVAYIHQIEIRTAKCGLISLRTFHIWALAPASIVLAAAFPMCPVQSNQSMLSAHSAAGSNRKIKLPRASGLICAICAPLNLLKLYKRPPAAEAVRGCFWNRSFLWYPFFGLFFHPVPRSLLVYENNPFKKSARFKLKPVGWYISAHSLFKWNIH